VAEKGIAKVLEKGNGKIGSNDRSGQVGLRKTVNKSMIYWIIEKGKFIFQLSIWKKMIKKILFFSLLIASNFSNAFLVQGYDVSKAWEGAQVYVPSNFLTKKVDDVKVDKSLPVVILLHGCGGIGDHEKKWAQNLKSEGFIVVLPDSFAIPNREINCVPSSNTPNVGKVPVNDLRPAQATFLPAYRK